MGKKGYTTFQWAIIVIGAILCFLPKYFISFEGLSASGVQVLFILIGGLLIWQCVGVDWSSLLCVLFRRWGQKQLFHHLWVIQP